MSEIRRPNSWIWGSGDPPPRADQAQVADFTERKITPVPSGTSLRESYNHIVMFKLIPPLALNKTLGSLWDAYHGPDSGPVDFVLYALLQEFNESLEQAVSMRRSKGGFVETHWGAKPSTIQATGQVGLNLSAFGLTPFQTEGETDGYYSDTVADWDPAASVTWKDGVKGSGYAVPVLNDKDNNSSTPVYPGTNLAFRKFRILLDLFKHNGMVFDAVPNAQIYPSTFTAPEMGRDADGEITEYSPSLIRSPASDEDILNRRKHAMLAPGNVLNVFPIQMYVKDTVYLGYFQNFSYSLSEDNPFIANYEFTFVSKLTQRTSIFYRSGTAGKKPYSIILDQLNAPTQSKVEPPATTTEAQEADAKKATDETKKALDDAKKATQPESLSDPLKSLEVGGTLKLDVLFDSDKATLTPASLAEIQGLATALLSPEHIKMRMSVEGHTDSTSTVAHNQTLSEQRAAAVKTALVAAGVSASRLESHGFGSTVPLGDNNTIDGRAKNRRVEVRRLSDGA